MDHLRSVFVDELDVQDNDEKGDSESEDDENTTSMERKLNVGNGDVIPFGMEPPAVVRLRRSHRAERRAKRPRERTRRTTRREKDFLAAAIRLRKRSICARIRQVVDGRLGRAWQGVIGVRELFGKMSFFLHNHTHSFSYLFHSYLSSSFFYFFYYSSLFSSAQAAYRKFSL